MSTDIKNYLKYYIDVVQYRVKYIDTSGWTVWTNLTATRLSKLDDASIEQIQIECRRLSSITEEEKEQAALSRGAGDGCGEDNVAEAHEFDYLLSRSFWLFGDEAFEKGLIIEKK